MTKYNKQMAIKQAFLAGLASIIVILLYGAVLYCVGALIELNWSYAEWAIITRLVLVPSFLLGSLRVFVE